MKKKKKGDITAQLIGKMKRAGVSEDVMQKLIGKMKGGNGDVTQRLLGMCSTAKKSVLDPITLLKGMYEFTDGDGKGVTSLPDNLLPQYLAAFVEEAYEHEKRECEHKKNAPTGHDEQVAFFARRVFNELVVCMRKNKDLMRAGKGVTSGSIASILRNSGLVQPDVSGYANPEGNGLEPMAYSESPRQARLAAAAKGEFIDDTIDPFAALQKAQAAQHHSVWRVPEMTFIAKGSSDCPIHGQRDLTKMMNLANTHGRCTCS